MTHKKKTIGRYPVVRLLGSGSMGRVYKVTHPMLEKTAALKLFKPGRALVQTLGIQKLRTHFIREASMIANIRHPNVVQVWSMEETEDGLFYLMDYGCRNLGKLMGETYWADTPSRKIPIAQAWSYLRQILSGLSRLHEAGIVHRDVKPFNIMISDTGNLKIVDFGLSKRRGEVPILPGQGMAIGTPFYIAPEQQISPEKADGRADLYSAGVMLYRMVSGRLPGHHMPLLSQSQHGLSLDWDQFMHKALAPDPDDRFQSASAMAGHLEQLYDQYDPDLDCVDASLALPDQPVDLPLRSRPERILAKNAAKTFLLNEFHQPVRYINNRYETSDELVVDHATGLIWQRSGSSIPLQWGQAEQYVKKLSQDRFSGLTHWRVPTIEELLSLLAPPSTEGYCQPKVFSDTQKCLWSADTRSKKSAWAMDLELGFIDSTDITDYHFVKGVCDLKHLNS